MTSNTKLRLLFCQDHCVRKVSRIRHQCGRCDDSMGVGFNYGAIHPASESEIIRIDNQSAQCDSLTKSSQHSVMPGSAHDVWTLMALACV